MTIIRRAVATAGLVLAILGLLGCLAGVAGTWAMKTRAQDAASAVFTAADGALEFVRARLTRVRARLDESRPQVNKLAQWAERLQTIELEPDGQAVVESLREYLDGVAAELKAAEGTLDPIEAVARGLEAATARLGGASIRAAAVGEFAGDLAMAARRLEALRVKVLEARERRLLARELAAICLTEAADLDTRLANLSTRIGDFGASVAAARSSSADAGRRVHLWIRLGAAMLAAALLWFAASQVCVMQRARGL